MFNIHRRRDVGAAANNTPAWMPHSFAFLQYEGSIADLRVDLITDIENEVDSDFEFDLFLEEIDLTDSAMVADRVADLQSEKHRILWFLRETDSRITRGLIQRQRISGIQQAVTQQRLFSKSEKKQNTEFERTMWFKGKVVIAQHRVEARLKYLEGILEKLEWS
ncbi:uncharacterized protein RAG0_00081 [Rhynchosporium agropyri]|uniref:Uncharacterized protein n=1 Tax=Rhynchosporium agropyri TaxID=914238 RepID=A0A1E1JR40_9HELO|nr:uncharacterized protein RAG0_00081 [Rhynchosporium agropyri]